MNEKKGLSLKSFIILLIVVFFISVIGGTYAYFTLSEIDNSSLTGDAAMVDLTLSVTRELPAIPHLIVPQLSGNVLQHAIREGCVDGQDNGTCLVYKIVVINGSTTSVDLDGSVTFHGEVGSEIDIEDAIPNLKWMLVSSYDESDVSLTVLGNGTIYDATSTKTSFDSNAYIEANDSRTYYLVVWLDETGSDQTGYSQVFFGDITFESTNGTGVTATFS